MNEAQKFWVNTYAEEYIKNSSQFDREKGVAAWKLLLEKVGLINPTLERGCNICRNIDFSNALLPRASKSIIETSQPAFKFVSSRLDLGFLWGHLYDSAEFDVTTCWPSFQKNL
jgi:hypothetical protein